MNKHGQCKIPNSSFWKTLLRLKTIVSLCFHSPHFALQRFFIAFSINKMPRLYFFPRNLVRSVTNTFLFPTLHLCIACSSSPLLLYVCACVCRSRSNNGLSQSAELLYFKQQQHQHQQILHLLLFLLLLLLLLLYLCKCRRAFTARARPEILKRKKSLRACAAVRQKEEGGESPSSSSLGNWGSEAYKAARAVPPHSVTMAQLSLCIALSMNASSSSSPSVCGFSSTVRICMPAQQDSMCVQTLGRSGILQPRYVHSHCRIGTCRNSSSWIVCSMQYVQKQYLPVCYAKKLRHNFPPSSHF